MIKTLCSTLALSLFIINPSTLEAGDDILFKRDKKKMQDKGKHEKKRNDDHGPDDIFYILKSMWGKEYQDELTKYRKKYGKEWIEVVSKEIVAWKHRHNILGDIRELVDDKRYKNKRDFDKHIREIMEEKMEAFETTKSIYEWIKESLNIYKNVAHIRLRINIKKEILKDNPDLNGEYLKKVIENRFKGATKEHRAIESDMKYLESKNYEKTFKTKYKKFVTDIKSDIIDLIEKAVDSHVETTEVEQEKLPENNYHKALKKRGERMKKIARGNADFKTYEKIGNKLPITKKNMGTIMEMLKVLGATEADIQSLLGNMHGSSKPNSGVKKDRAKNAEDWKRRQEERRKNRGHATD